MISSLELARICGVSQGTVDRALHDRPGVSAATRKRVLAAARKHGYRPHPGVRELLGAKSSQVAAIVPAVNSLFFMDLLEVIRTRLAQDGLRMLICPAADRNEFIGWLDEMAARRAAGAVVIPPEAGIAVPGFVRKSMPIISLLAPCRGRGVTFVAPDEVATGRRAVDYLAGMGHERIMHLTYTRRSYAISARARGYRVRMRELGLQPMVIAPFMGDKSADRIVKRKVTAIFCHNDWLALSAIRALGRKGLDVPADISVLGVDNSPSFVSICPDISTMQYPCADIAAAVLTGLRGGKILPRISAPEIVERVTVRRITRPS